MSVVFYKLHKDAVIPQYVYPDDSGMDLSSIEEVEIEPGDVKLVHTGLTIQLESQTEAQVRPRSGLALKNKITVLNTPGTIDEGYRGEICVILINLGTSKFKVEKGMRIAQLVIAPVIRAKVNTDMTLLAYPDATQRGSNGFGSTGV